MLVAVTLRTTLKFEDFDDINRVQDIILDDMAPDKILEMAKNQGNVINIDVDEY